MEADGIAHRHVQVNGIRMHVAEKGEGPVVLFLHGFPELWYSWRRQILALSAAGFRAVAPDLRGYGDTECPPAASSYTYFHVVGDLVALVESLGEERVFVVGHDWGAAIAWQLCLWRPDRVRALVNLSIAFSPRHTAAGKVVDSLRRTYGDDHYIVEFQEPGAMEALIAKLGAEYFLKRLLTYRSPDALCIKKHVEDTFGSEITLPPWLTMEDVAYYCRKFDKTGFTGGINYYRCLDLSWELAAPWSEAQVKVPTKFIVGDLDLTYNLRGVKDFIHSGGMKKYVPLLDEVVIIKDAGHFIQQERAAEVNDHILDFFKEF